ncbi:MAG: 50S ribosomal protein L19e [Sulfolobales archaeon]|nr:50S ribosomal protein L19e [Sulfolobales archaeon]MCX8208880.1 50S ribosomal protein L19e [Sulfolobales archaeon]MDW8011138.1 50S ribosomal protein L19e [Sulfolobales archaeon]
MVDLSIQRRLAAEILGVGEGRVRFDPENLEKVESALTREDVKKLIREGIIWVEPRRRNSRGRWKERHEKRRRGHRRGPGKRKGAKNAREDPKERWVNTIRKIRRFIKWMRDSEVIDTVTYRKLYRLAKGGAFKSLSDLKRHLAALGIQVR